MRLLFPILLTFLCCCREPGSMGHFGADSGRNMVFAFYNLENAFDPADDPLLAGDDEFTPGGPMKWTTERLERKLSQVGRAIRAMDDYRGADLIGLCEVENRRVVELLAQEYLPSGEYGLVHSDSPDERGIDVAILYRRALFTLVGFKPHRVDLGPGERSTRDILEATFRRDGRNFTVLACHWPSRSGGERESEPRRLAAARTVASVVDSLYSIDPRSDIVMMGDLNDEPGNRSLTEVLGAAEYRDRTPFTGRMINTAAPLKRADTIGSYFYRGHWNLLDQILLSRGALDSSGVTMTETSEIVFAPDFLRDDRADERFRPPYRTYRGTWYMGGPSDHFPVMLRVGWSGG